MDVCSSARPPMLALALLVTSCGAAPNASDLHTNKTDALPTLAVMGGFTTCSGEKNDPGGMGLMAPFRELYAELTEALAATPNVLLSCFDDEANIFFKTSLEEADTAKPGAVTDVVHALSNLTQPDSKIYLVGHSYGGWLAMKSALELSAKKRLGGLVSIDPISRERCSFELPFGCQSAPQDIIKSQRESIAASTDKWHHYYQVNTWYLHSSKIEEADISQLVDTSHTAIGEHEEVWQGVEDLFEILFDEYI